MPKVGTGEIILIVAVLLLFFGSRKLPELARSIGKSARELRKGLAGDDDDEDDSKGDAKGDSKGDAKDQDQPDEAD